MDPLAIGKKYRLESQPPVHFKAQATKTNLRRGQCEATACLHAGGHTTSNAPDRAKDFASSKERSRGERRRNTIASCAGTTYELSCAHAGSRTRVTSMGGLYDAATLRAQFQFRDCVVQENKKPKRHTSNQVARVRAALRKQSAHLNEASSSPGCGMCKQTKCDMKQIWISYVEQYDV